jgi:polyhydroxyalkanoate synthesis regulator phasin
MATSNLCCHLVTHHLDSWIKGCEDLNIKITAEDARPFVDEHLCRQGKFCSGKSSEKMADEIPEFMDKLYTDAIIDWIVTDDQVI